jgi:hypothetical protein
MQGLTLTLPSPSTSAESAFLHYSKYKYPIEEDGDAVLGE